MWKLNLDLDGVKKEYTLPSSWDDVTVKQFQQIVNLDNNQLLGELQKTIAVIEIVSGISRTVIEAMDYETDFTDLVNNVKFLMEEIPVSEDDIKDSIMIKDEEYILKKDFTKLTTGEMASFDVIFKRNNNNIYNCINELLPLFIRKKGDEKYDSANHYTLVEMMENEVKIVDVMKLFTFFSNTSEN